MARKGRGVARNGRSKRGERFILVPNAVFDSPAFRSLRAVPRALLLEIIRRHDGSNNGSIGLGERAAAEELRMADRAAVRRAFRELQSVGLIRCHQPGGFNVKAGGRRQSEWRLTWLPSASGAPPSLEYLAWKPPAEQNSRGRKPAQGGQEICQQSPFGLRCGQETYPLAAVPAAGRG